MPSPQHTQLEEIFAAALELGTPAERTAFVKGACGSDGELRTRVQELLNAHGQASSFLSAPVIDPHATVETPADKRQDIGSRIGPYRILQEIGEGGFGIVFLAEQDPPVRRQVALKVIKLGMDTRQVIARFEVERQALALMDHPHIARVLDAGATESGRPYFVMELVRGLPLTEYCDKNRVTFEERLRLFLPVCDAVQHAHQKGVIHRDLKPSNVLVTMQDGKPVPKVIDFGIAKATRQRLTDKTLFTEFRQFIGTPEYMSPDQADTSDLDVDTRTDIYSLGVVLYRLLTGGTPVDAKTLRHAGIEDIKRILREVEPPRPSLKAQTTITQGVDLGAQMRVDSHVVPKRLRGDLDWIIMKALEKDRTRRYQTANDFAQEIQRHLNNQPVLAGPPRWSYRASKFVRRNRIAVGVTLTVALFLVGALAAALTGYVEARRAGEQLRLERDAARFARAEADRAREAELTHRQDAEASAARAQVTNAFLKDMLASVDPRRAQGREITVRYVLDEAAHRLAAGALADHPEVEADVRLTLAETFDALGAYAAGEAQIRAALERQTALRGADHPSALATQSLLAAALNSQFKHSEAEGLARRIHAEQERLLGRARPETLLTLNRLGVALAGQGKWSEAEDALDRALADQRRVLGEEDPETLRTLANLGMVYNADGRFAQAESLLRRVLTSQRRLLGGEHPDVMLAMNSLAQSLEKQGKLEEAERLYREGWDLDRRILGPDHPRTQIPLNNLLRVLGAQGKLEQTRELVQARLAHLRAAAEAPDASPTALSAYAWELATCEPADLRDAGQAVRFAERAVALGGRSDANLLETLARTYQLAGDGARAITTQQEALQVALRGGPYNRNDIQRRLMDMLYAEGRFLEAASFQFAGVAADVSRTVIEDYSSVGGTLMSQAQERLERRDLEQAEQLLRACLSLRQKELPARHWWLVAETRSLLGQVVSERGRKPAAERMLLDAYAALSEDANAPGGLRRLTRERIIALYESWGRPDEAQRWRAPPSPPAPAAP